MNPLLGLLCVLPLLSAGEMTSQAFNLEEKDFISLAPWLARDGDQPEWASNPGPDSAWSRVSPRRILGSGGGPGPEGNFWLQTVITLAGKQDPADTLALLFNRLPSAFDVFWDGLPVGQNGRVGQDRRSEEPGRIRLTLPLNPGLTGPGPHRLALRVSNHRIGGRRHRFLVSFGYRSTLADATNRMKEEYLLFAGLFLAATLFSLLLFLGGWRYFPALFFSLFTLIQLLYSVWEVVLRSEAVGVSLFYRLAPLVGSGNLVSQLPLYLFLFWHLDLPFKKPASWGLGAYVLIRVLLFHWFELDLWQIDLLIALAMGGLVIRQFRRRGTGVSPALIGYSFFLLNWVAVVLAPILPWLAFVKAPFVSLLPSSVFIVGLMGSMTAKIREQFRTLESLRYRSQRLEAELIKKSIQPHFLMNTLLSIKSWLGQDSATAEKMVEALAEEFRMINGISSKPEIALEEELSLCRRHLELMGYRREARYELRVIGSCRGFTIPPMILHTLVENGLTHAFKPAEDGSFLFTCRREPRWIVYRLENGGSKIPDLMKTGRERIEEGLGLRYVKVRLEEAYPGKWRLDYGLDGSVWAVTIVLEAT